MAYADQQMSGNRIVAIIIVALIHVAVGYALVTGLAYSAVKKAIESYPEDLRVVVFGTGTSAHDICQDLHVHGAAQVTMIQRAPTIVGLSWGVLSSAR